jgi:hypothetical protein
MYTKIYRIFSIYAKQSNTHLKQVIRKHSKLYKFMEVPVLLYGCEEWTLMKEHKRRNDRAETKFLPSVAGYTSYGHGTNEEKREECNTYSSNESTVYCTYSRLNIYQD